MKFSKVIYFRIPAKDVRALPHNLARISSRSNLFSDQFRRKDTAKKSETPAQRINRVLQTTEGIVGVTVVLVCSVAYYVHLRTASTGSVLLDFLLYNSTIQKITHVITQVTDTVNGLVAASSCDHARARA